MMKASNLFAATGIASILAFSTLTSPLQQEASAAGRNISARMAFRWHDAYDTSYRQQKWTTSAYILNSTKVTNGYYTASAWGHSYLAGRTGNVDVSEGHSYRVYSNRSYVLYNKLVEWYGKGNNAYIWGESHSDNNAYGTWRADR